MITKEEALTADRFHLTHECCQRFAESVPARTYERTSRTKTWLRHPDRWALGIRFGQEWLELTSAVAPYWHIAGSPECPYAGGPKQYLRVVGECE